MVSGLDSGALAHGVVFSVPSDSSKNNPISAELSNISSADSADMSRQSVVPMGAIFGAVMGGRGGHTVRWGVGIWPGGLRWIVCGLELGLLLCMASSEEIRRKEKDLSPSIEVTFARGQKEEGMSAVP